LAVRGPDGYEGWTHRGYLVEADGSEVTWRWSMGCRVRLPNGASRALPFGARLAPSAELESGDAVSAAARAERFLRTASAIADSAAWLFEGASYLWGGITPWGCDCSGFVQRIFGWHGERLPRDAWQQALHGERITTAANATHAPGDLLFFSDREDKRITHVGIALVGRRMVHSSLTRGGVAIEDLASGDEYVERLRAQCVDVRRYLSAQP
jgi:gamma-D-glutamyl-L-lysine dipeptidyl-peptidase